MPMVGSHPLDDPAADKRVHGLGQMNKLAAQTTSTVIVAKRPMDQSGMASPVRHCITLLVLGKVALIVVKTLEVDTVCFCLIRQLVIQLASIFFDHRRENR